MSAALSIVSSAEEDLKRDSRTCTDAENLARHIIARMESVTAKLKSLEDDIRRLWLEFDKLKAGETILGCATKKEFCERKLHRTPRAIRYMLDGGNLSNQRAEEIISPEPESQERATQPEPHNQPKRPAPVYIAPAKPEIHWISKGNGCPSGKRAFDSAESLHEARKAEGKPQPVAYFNCRQCGKVHMDKGQTADRHVTFYPEPQPTKPHAAVDPNKINRHLVGAQVGDVLTYNTSMGSCSARIITLDDKEVTIQTGKTSESLHTFPLDIDTDTIRGNASKAQREPEYQHHTGRKGHCAKCRAAGFPNGEEPCIVSAPVEPTPTFVKPPRHPHVAENEIRDWLSQKCPLVSAALQGSIYAVQARSAFADSPSCFDLQLRSITKKQVQAVCALVQKMGGSSTEKTNYLRPTPAKKAKPFRRKVSR